jgi:hypothetical protein
MTILGPVNGNGVLAQRPTDEDSTMTTASSSPEIAISGDDLGGMLISEHAGKCLSEEMRARWVTLLLQSAREAGLPSVEPVAAELVEPDDTVISAMRTDAKQVSRITAIVHEVRQLAMG